MAEVDVLVVGAGPGGLMTAWRLAEAGWRVVVLDKRTSQNLGKPIRVSVEEKIFSQLNLPPPRPPILLSSPASREFISPDNKHKLVLRSAPVLRLDHRGFTQSLQARAEAAGAHFLFETEVNGPLLSSGQVRGVVASTAKGQILELPARLTIDASGIQAVIRHQLPREFGLLGELSSWEVCNAWQESRELDRAQVMDLVSRNRLRPQVEVCRLGFMGPYSLFSVFLDLEDDRVEITAGLLHAAGFPPARDLVKRYVESHSWIGEIIHRAGGLIPVRRPLDNLVAHGFACVGDAAGQAIPQHASGVASALLAGQLLAEVAARALADGDLSRSALWPYNFRYMNERGVVQANSELFRRFLLTLSADELSALFGSGLFTEEAVHGSLEGLPLELPRSAVISVILKFLSRPRLLGRMWRLSKNTRRAFQLYQSYPPTDDAQPFSRWQATADKIFPPWEESGSSLASPAAVEGSDEEIKIS